MADFTFAPLTPISMLERATAAFADRIAVIDGELRMTFREFSDRCARLISVLASEQIVPGDRVAALCANSHTMLELHHAVPARGAVLVSVNIRLSVDEMVYIVEHSGSSLLVATVEFAERAEELRRRTGIRLIIAGGAADEYEELLTSSVAEAQDRTVVNERDLIAINYTSGTTGPPKGVMIHHRGAYLQAVAMAHHARLSPGARYLWTLPMFHANGWCFTWAVTGAGGTHVCLRTVDTAEIWGLLRAESITHLSAAPTVLAMLGQDPAAGLLDPRVHVDTGGAPPSPSLLRSAADLGMDVTHLYGLTETFGPIAINEWQPEWSTLADGEVARLRARQGVGNLIARPLRVLDVDGTDVVADGEAVGEIAVSGNNVMLGYFRDRAATDAVTRGGYLLTGDLGVMHPDGYIEIRDRLKDIIISGGENIASVEIEHVLDAHPAVLESAVVGCPDPLWGEVPAAFVTPRQGASVSESELVAHVRVHLAGFKVPKRFIFMDLPRTSTGKLAKNRLREAVRKNAVQGEWPEAE